MHRMISRSKTATHSTVETPRHEEDDPGDQSLANSITMESTPVAQVSVAPPKKKGRTKTPPIQPAKKIQRMEQQPIESSSPPENQSQNHQIEDVDLHSIPDIPVHNPPMPKASEIPNIRLRPLDTTLLTQLLPLKDHQLDTASAMLRSYGLNPTAPPHLIYDLDHLRQLTQHLVRLRTAATPDDVVLLGPDFLIPFLTFCNVPAHLVNHDRLHEACDVFEKMWLPSARQLATLTDITVNQLPVPAIRAYLAILGHIPPAAAKKEALLKTLWEARCMTVANHSTCASTPFQRFMAPAVGRVQCSPALITLIYYMTRGQTQSPSTLDDMLAHVNAFSGASINAHIVNPESLAELPTSDIRHLLMFFGFDDQTTTPLTKDMLINLFPTNMSKNFPFARAANAADNRETGALIKAMRASMGVGQTTSKAAAPPTWPARTHTAHAPFGEFKKRAHEDDSSVASSSSVSSDSQHGQAAAPTDASNALMYKGDDVSTWSRKRLLATLPLDNSHTYAPLSDHHLRVLLMRGDDQPNSLPLPPTARSHTVTIGRHTYKFTYDDITAKPTAELHHLLARLWNVPAIRVSDLDRPVVIARCWEDIVKRSSHTFAMSPHASGRSHNPEPTAVESLAKQVAKGSRKASEGTRTRADLIGRHPQFRLMCATPDASGEAVLYNLYYNALLNGTPCQASLHDFVQMAHGLLRPNFDAFIPLTEQYSQDTAVDKMRPILQIRSEAAYQGPIISMANNCPNRSQKTMYRVVDLFCIFWDADPSIMAALHRAVDRLTEYQRALHLWTPSNVLKLQRSFARQFDQVFLYVALDDTLNVPVSSTVFTAIRTLPEFIAIINTLPNIVSGVGKREYELMEYESYTALETGTDSHAVSSVFPPLSTESVDRAVDSEEWEGQEGTEVLVAGALDGDEPEDPVGSAGTVPEAGEGEDWEMPWTSRRAKYSPILSDTVEHL